VKARSYHSVSAFSNLLQLFIFAHWVRRLKVDSLHGGVHCDVPQSQERLRDLDWSIAACPPSANGFPAFSFACLPPYEIQNLDVEKVQNLVHWWYCTPWQIIIAEMCENEQVPSSTSINHSEASQEIFFFFRPELK
jgi:hypothetical protein